MLFTDCCWSQSQCEIAQVKCWGGLSETSANNQQSGSFLLHNPTLFTRELNSRTQGLKVISHVRVAWRLQGRTTRKEGACSVVHGVCVCNRVRGVTSCSLWSSVVHHVVQYESVVVRGKGVGVQEALLRTTIVVQYVARPRAAFGHQQFNLQLQALLARTW